MENGKKEKLGSVVLLILDGWGIAVPGIGNAIARAKIPVFKELTAKYPAATLALSSLLTAKKKIDISDNYQAIGTGKKKASKSDLSIFDCFDRAGLKWFSISDPEKVAYGAFFINNKKKVKPENFLAVAAQADDEDFLAPAQSVELLGTELLKKIKGRKVDFILAIVSGLDLAGHHGDLSAAVETVETIDRLLGNLTKTVLSNSGVLFVASSHGNAEELLDPKTELTNGKDTKNPVPFIIAGKEFEGKTFGLEEAPNNDLSLITPAGDLTNIAPTILKIMGLEIPEKMEGKSLI